MGDQLLDIVHPAARILTDIARSQDAEVGDGTTSVVVIAGEILKEAKAFVEEGVSSQVIIKGLRTSSRLAVNKIKEIAVKIETEDKRDTLMKLASTAMSSKLIKRNSGFFTKSTRAKSGFMVSSLCYIIANDLRVQWLSMLSTRLTRMSLTRSSLV